MTTLTILPPGLTSEFTLASSEKKAFDSLEFLPNKIESGGSEEIRLLGTFSTGHMLAPWRCGVEEKQPDGTLRFAGFDYSNDYEGFPNAARMTDWAKPDRPKIDGEHVKPKRALCALVYSYSRQRVELAVIEQRSLRDGLVEILNDEDFAFDSADIANFVLKIGKQGSGLETSYSILPKPRKVEAAVAKAFEEVRETAMVADLLEGRHPLNKPKAEFKSDASADGEF